MSQRNLWTPRRTYYEVMTFDDMPGVIVAGGDHCSVAMSFTKEGRCALFVEAYVRSRMKTYLGLRQGEFGKLESFEPPAFDEIDEEHPFLRRTWGILKVMGR